MRKIILNLAMSLDGYIADEKGGFDWIVGDGDGSNNTEASFDFQQFIESVDTIVMGSKAFEDAPEGSLDSYKDKKILVATSRQLVGPSNVEFIKGDICSRLLEIKKEPGLDIWLYGGGQINDFFIKADMVDTYIVGIIPVILGSGRPMFLKNNPRIKLRLTGNYVDEGVTILTYEKRK